MSGLDKILEHITREAEAEAEGILSSARESADKILASGREDADQMAQAIRKQSELDVAAAADRIRSASDLREKRIILQAKQEKIEDVFASARKTLTGLSDEAYFSVIQKMIARYATGREGQILFSETDLKRLPEDFRQTMQQYHLEVGKESRDISGGFVLTYGEIEENCSFDILIESAREELQDKIGQILFS
ncbi:MAG: V-type ATP synthase subunit E [Parasporobacterium sp.]|nr:V-type ATP synthase subunit E [Parasporobacterium sp.]MBQ9033009.1 V-type ATP synthase subunit E [Parasporobacterium sp.]